MCEWEGRGRRRGRVACNARVIAVYVHWDTQWEIEQ